MPTFQNYLLVLNKNPEFNITQYDKILNNPSSKYTEKISNPQLLSKTGSFPTRIVTASFTSSFERFGEYHFQDSETGSILNLDDVSKLVRIPTKAEQLLTSYSAPYPTESFIHANFRQTGGSVRNSNNWNQHVPTSSLGNYCLYFHSLPPEDMYSSSLSPFADETTKLFLGSGSNVVTRSLAEPSASLFKDFNYPINGANVDVVICEGQGRAIGTGGTTKYNNSAMEYNHPDFFGLDGNTRVQYINWSLYQWPFNLNNWRGWYLNTGSFFPNDFLSVKTHKQMVASNAVGLYNGFAKGANIFFLPVVVTNMHINILGWFHRNKPINPKTGRQNPTIVNMSFGNGYQYPFRQFEAGGKSSGSFIFSDQGDEKGFRIAHFGKDYMFISKSNIPDYPYVNINFRNGGSGSPTFVKNAASIFFYTSSDLSDLEKVMNDNISDYFTTSIDLTTNTISITQSTDYRVYNPKIYTGSYSDFFDTAVHPNLTSGAFPVKGGGFALELTGGHDSNTHINKIVVKGQEVATGSNLWPNAQHGWQKLPPFDHYGIDRGFNIQGDPLNDFYQPSNYWIPDEDTGSGWTNSFVGNFHETNGSAKGQELNNVLYEGLADLGIILVTSAGNQGHYCTAASSSIEENPYFDSENYDDDLWNTYHTIDTKFPNSVLMQSAPLGTPQRFFVPSLVNNNTIIQAGLINWRFDTNGTYYSGTTGGNRDDITGSGVFLNNIVTNPTTKEQRWGYHVEDYSVSGKGVDVFAMGAHTTMAGVGNNGNAYVYPANVDFYNNFKFNTKSVDDAYTQSFMSLDYYSNDYFFDIPQIAPGQLSMNKGGALASTINGGTSNAAPRVTGAIACYLQLYPSASLQDVRKWLRDNATTMPTSYNEGGLFYKFNRFAITSSLTQSLYEQTYYPNNGMDEGPNPRILRFPYANSRTPFELSGSLKMKGVNFSL